MIIPIKTALGGYDIVIERGALKKKAPRLLLGRGAYCMSVLPDKGNL